MKIMSLNGWGGRVHERLVPYLAETEPDILCLQEVVHTPGAPRHWLTYRDTDIELPQRANFFDDVASALPDHVAIFCPAAIGDLWDEEIRVASQWGLATFVHRRVPIVAQAQGFVHKSFSANSYGSHPRSRSAHVVRVFDFELGEPVVVGHMHGLRDLAGKGDTHERRNQAQRLSALIASVTEPGDAIVACGDFNVLPGSETFDTLKKMGLNDLVTGRGFTSTRTSLYTKPNRFADYMAVSQALDHAQFDA